MVAPARGIHTFSPVWGGTPSTLLTRGCYSIEPYTGELRHLALMPGAAVVYLSPSIGGAAGESGLDAVRPFRSLSLFHISP